MNFQQIEQYLKKREQPKFRLNQIKDVFYKQYFSFFREITVLPKNLRIELDEKFAWYTFDKIKIEGSIESGSIKALLKLKDGLFIESVVMVYRDWVSVCLSCMSGCPLDCLFCATGQGGFKRNLDQYEIVDQIVFWNSYLRLYGKKISKVVFMGMGEPFLNWENVKKSIETINGKDGLNIGQRNISISTAGIINGINSFTDLKTEINLSVSLHSPFQNQREKIMPLAKDNNISDLFTACKNYVNKTKRKLLFEYALISEFNDREEDVIEIKKLINHYLFQLNIINLHKTNCPLESSSPARKTLFIKLLEKNKIPFTIRRSIGEEITGSCGQLSGQV